MVRAVATAAQGGVKRVHLTGGEPLNDFFEQAIAQKPEHPDLLIAIPAGSQRGMSQMGG